MSPVCMTSRRGMTGGRLTWVRRRLLVSTVLGLLVCLFASGMTVETHPTVGTRRFFVAVASSFPFLHTRLQGFSSQKLAELYRDYAPSLYHRAWALTRDAEEAADIMQDAFLGFMMMGRALRGEASPFTLLYQIVTYRAVDRLRRRARWTGQLALSWDEEPECTRWCLDRALYAGGLDRVEAAHDLALLTQGEKPGVLTAAFLHFVEGHSIGQVGQILQLPRKTVEKMLKQFMKRARARQARLEEEMPP